MKKLSICFLLIGINVFAYEPEIVEPIVKQVLIKEECTMHAASPVIGRNRTVQKTVVKKRNSKEARKSLTAQEFAELLAQQPM